MRTALTSLPTCRAQWPWLGCWRTELPKGAREASEAVSEATDGGLPRGRDEGWQRVRTWTRAVKRRYVTGRWARKKGLKHLKTMWGMAKKHSKRPIT